MKKKSSLQSFEAYRKRMLKKLYRAEAVIRQQNPATKDWRYKLLSKPQIRIMQNLTSKQRINNSYQFVQGFQIRYIQHLYGHAMLAEDLQVSEHTRICWEAANDAIRGLKLSLADDYYHAMLNEHEKLLAAVPKEQVATKSKISS